MLRRQPKRFTDGTAGQTDPLRAPGLTCFGRGKYPAPDADDDGGYDISITRDVIRDIRNMLHASARTEGGV